MLLQLLIVVLIIGLLVAGPSFENILITIGFYGGIIGSLVVAFLYAGRVSGGIADFLSGIPVSGKTDRAIARAERSELERGYEEAVRLYQQIISKDRKNPAPRLKLAELHFKLRDYDKYLQQMHEMLDACRKMPMSERCALINRMADIYLQRKKDPAAAVEILSRIIAEFPKTKYAGYARERIAGLR
ncbi:MAG: hypothetical protein C4520_15650 [Candidatus Abyssobacteria bacterium SURF_5]|uniref:Tetratricopeptide repeat protein n=1 Tax=Abyssobacteria bacterium (strain SURF_5) TaxID=2093360 RepID=A0A3A4N813_ABYX5|nr:MAG: hypothetical protein C4520_15650 [Candidatus Abyssubacteria bacterium SURF_5]